MRVRVPRLWPIWVAATVVIIAGDWFSCRAGYAATEIRINTASVSLIPTQTDFDNNFVQKLGATGISLDVRTTSNKGCTLAVRGEAAGAGRINPADVSVKSATSGSLITSFTAISTTNLNLWKITTSKSQFTTAPSPILVDIRVSNLGVYPAGSYTNTLTFTVTQN